MSPVRRQPSGTRSCNGISGSGGRCGSQEKRVAEALRTHSSPRLEYAIRREAGSTQSGVAPGRRDGRMTTRGDGRLAVAKAHLDRVAKQLITLQSSEIQKRFSHIQQSISEATRSCQSAQSSVPQDLKSCVEELNKQCQSAQSVMKTQDEDRMRQCIDKMEEIGDRAERACNTAGNMDGELKRAVSTVHSELSDLRRQLH